jgi:hypothetical protein
MATNNGNFQNDAEEYEWVLNNKLLFDAVFDAFGYEPIAEYGSYRQVDTWMRGQILNWLHAQDFYWDEVWGVNDYGEEEEDEEEDEDEEEEEGEEDVVAQSELLVQQNEDDQQQNVVEQQNVVVPQNKGEQQAGFHDPYNLEKRITDLEIVFKRLKESKNMMESREESSGSNKLG